MSNKAHEKWLRKMGVHPDQIKQRKTKRKVAVKSDKTVASSYYEDKPLRAYPTFKKEEGKSLDNKDLAFRIMEENRTSPRDLGGDKDYSR